MSEEIRIGSRVCVTVDDETKTGHVLRIDGPVDVPAECTAVIRLDDGHKIEAPMEGLTHG